MSLSPKHKKADYNMPYFLSGIKRLGTEQWLLSWLLLNVNM